MLFRRLLHGTVENVGKILAPPLPSLARYDPLQRLLHNTPIKLRGRKGAQEVKRLVLKKGFVDYGYRLFRGMHEHYMRLEKAEEPAPYAPLSRYAAEMARRRRIQMRLVAHSFIHALLTRNKRFEAARFAELAMERGVELRGPTFRAVFNQLVFLTHKTVDKTADRHLSLILKSDPKPAEQHDDIGDRTSAALSLLRTARERRQGRSSWMYDRVIDLCLFQGEVITAALLFAVLVRDWQLRKAVLREATDGSGTASPKYDFAEAERLGMINQKSLSFPQPRSSMLHRITAALGLDQSLTANYRYEWPTKPTFKQARAALYKLVDLVEEGEWRVTPIDDIHRILRVMSDISIRDHARIEDYERFHAILLQYCTKPPIRKLPQPWSLSTHNALLRYALRHRRDPKLALRVLRRTCQYHQPTAATWNIVIREASLMDEKAVVETLAAIMAEAHASWLFTLLPPDTWPPLSPQWQEIVQSLAERPIPPPTEFLLTTLMSHAISADAAGATRVIEFLKTLFPSFRDGGVRAKPPPRVSYTYSIYFWNTALNAAAKAGDYAVGVKCWRHMHRIDMRTRAHEKIAKTGRFDGQLISVEAFTTMFQLLANHLRGNLLEQRATALEAPRARFAAILQFLREISEQILIRRRAKEFEPSREYPLDSRFSAALDRLVAAIDASKAVLGLPYLPVSSVDHPREQEKNRWLRRREGTPNPTNIYIPRIEHQSQGEAEIVNFVSALKDLAEKLRTNGIERTTLGHRKLQPKALVQEEKTEVYQTVKLRMELLREQGIDPAVELRKGGPYRVLSKSLPEVFREEEDPMLLEDLVASEQPVQGPVQVKLTLRAKKRF